MAALHKGSVSHAKGVSQVFHPLLAFEAGLGGGVANAADGVQDRFARAVGDEFGEHRRLVEIAFPEAHRMERHRDEAVEGMGPDALVFEGFREPVRERVAKIELLSVLEPVNEVPDHALALILGDGACEMILLASAPRADKSGVNGAGERFGAALAEGWLDAPGLRAAGGA
jgi:hypothetical protein